MLDVIAPSSECQMTTRRKGRRYLATVGKGEATSLQGDKSDVKLEIKEGCPKRAYLMEVRTDLSSFRSFLEDDECFISPIVEVLAPAETSSSSFTLQIPHCLDEHDDKGKVKVRMIHENRVPAVVEVPVRAKRTDDLFFYDIDSNFIELHTPHFCEVICTICMNPYHCRGRINSLWFAKFETEQKKIPRLQKFTKILTGLFHKKKSSVQHQVEIRPYFGGVLYDIVDFRKVKLSKSWRKHLKHFYLTTSMTLQIKCEDGNLH